MNVIIAGITSDIGAYIAHEFIIKGYVVYGTYRKDLKREIEEDIIASGGGVYHCDFSDKNEIDNVIEHMLKEDIRWDIFVSAVGIMEPIEEFQTVSIDEWEQNIYINTMSQLRLLRGILGCRAENASVFFMTSKGVNDTFPKHSAYGLSKIMLIKMCEFLDDEIDDCKFVSFNPGYIKTKIISQEPGIYVSPGANTLDDDYNEREMNKVFRFIRWAIGIDKKAVSGKNFFVKYDDWENNEFVDFLSEDVNTYKLRRNRDEWVNHKNVKSS